MGRACGEPDDIELTAMGVELNGSQVHVLCVELDGRVHLGRQHPHRVLHGNVTRREPFNFTPTALGSNGFRPPICTRAESPHGGASYVQTSCRNQEQHPPESVTAPLFNQAVAEFDGGGGNTYRNVNVVRAAPTKPGHRCGLAGAWERAVDPQSTRGA